MAVSPISPADGLKALPEATLAAVGSRSQEKAQAFADKHGASQAHGSYADLVSPNRTLTSFITYVATPHPMHAQDAILCLDHGKAVLCEKPFTVNANQAEPS